MLWHAPHQNCNITALAPHSHAFLARAERLTIFTHSQQFAPSGADLDLPGLLCSTASVTHTASMSQPLEQAWIHLGCHAVQHCRCLPGLQIANADPYIVRGLWRLRCVSQAGGHASTIALFTVLGLAIVAALAAAVAIVILRNRHALGPPGQHPERSCIGACLVSCNDPASASAIMHMALGRPAGAPDMVKMSRLWVCEPGLCSRAGNVQAWA